MKYIFVFILILFSLLLFSQRSQSIEIEIDINLIPQEITNSNTLDIEYSSKEEYFILWIHPDSSYKPFKQEHFQYLGAARSAYNRKTKTDNLNIYIETNGEVGEYDEGVEGIIYKNLKFSELGLVDLSKLKFKRDIKNNQLNKQLNKQL